jgi:hypothetical protein
MKSKTKNTEKKVWVEVEVNKYTDGITVFRGQMQKTDLDAWSKGELVECSIKLEKTYWFLEDNICVLGKGDDNARQYTGDTYLRADTIMLIFVLKDDSFPSQYSPNVDNIFPFPGRSKH